MPSANQATFQAPIYMVLQTLNVNLSAMVQACSDIQLNINDLSHMTIDSRKLHENSIFIALFGIASDGHEFIPQAIDNGCRLILRDTKDKGQHGQINVVGSKNNGKTVVVSAHQLRDQLAAIASTFFVRDMQCLPSIIGVTGTNGKTSVAALIAQLASLTESPVRTKTQNVELVTTQGKDIATGINKAKSGTIGTLGVNLYAQGKLSSLSTTINTTPDTLTLFEYLQQFTEKQCDVIALEASSHGLEQGRLNQVPINCAVFTNLTQDHLDYHHNMQDYAKAKRLLLKAQDLQYVVLNQDDQESQNWQVQIKPALTTLWYSTSSLIDEKQGCWASDIIYNTTGVEFMLHVRLHQRYQQVRLRSPLIGQFNVANLLAAITALLVQGYDLDELVHSVAHLSGVAGRMELFASKRASMLVDYAHTPDALKQALLAARVHTKGTLSCVFGCGGDRDKSKREIMGKIANDYADTIVLTQDNSRTEAPELIIDDIKKGISLQHKPLSIILDRKAAIAHAWKNSTQQDMIVVAGKGHEQYIEINNKRITYDEREYVQQIAMNQATFQTEQAQMLQHNMQTTLKNKGSV